MELTLPPELAATYAARPATAPDLDAVYDLVVADRTHYFGTCRVTRETVAARLSSSLPALSVVVEAVGRPGRVEQLWEATIEPGTPNVLATLSPRPGLADVDALDRAAWACILRWAASVVPDPSEAVVRSLRPLPDEAARIRLEREGFAFARTFWNMGGDVPDGPDGSEQPAEVAISAGADPELVYRLLQDGFVGHYAYSPQSFEDWLSAEEAQPGYDPSLWFVAALDGQPVAAMILGRRAQSRGALFVDELATLEHARGHGAGTALLHKAFDVARQEGLTRLELFVDSENAHGAPALYRGVGLEVLQAMAWYERPLEPVS